MFGVGALIAGAVGVAVWLGFASARQSTQALLTERAQTLIGSMEATIEGRFRPIVEQSDWIRQQVETGALDLSDTDALDAFMRGAFAGTPEVAGIAIVNPDAKSRRWGRTDLDLGLERLEYMSLELVAVQSLLPPSRQRLAPPLEFRGPNRARGGSAALGC